MNCYVILKQLGIDNIWVYKMTNSFNTLISVWVMGLLVIFLCVSCYAMAVLNDVLKQEEISSFFNFFLDE